MAIMKYSYRRPVYSMWDPFPEMSNRLSKLLGQPLVDSDDFDQWTPSFNLSETPDDLNLSVELPGISKEDISIKVEDNILKLTGEKSSVQGGSEGGQVTHVRERSFGAFSRAVRLPKTVDASRISAELRNGILEVTLPKALEARGREIPIKAL